MSHLQQEIEARLQTRRLGRPLVVLERTTSTMAAAREQLRSGAGPGAAVVAEEQTAGRGRLDRPFVSPPGGLYLTVILEPPPDPADGWRCGFAAALAARRAVFAARGPELTFDWPNDLVIGDRKVGGILLELLDLSAGDRRAFVLLLGLGLNLGPDPHAVDPAAAGPAGPVSALPPGDHRAIVAAAFLGALEELAPRCGEEPGWLAVLESVRAISRAARGYPVAVRDADGNLVTGSGVGIQADGALRIRTPEGREVVVRYGERVYSAR